MFNLFFLLPTITPRSFNTVDAMPQGMAVWVSPMSGSWLGMLHSYVLCVNLCFFEPKVSYPLPSSETMEATKILLCQIQQSMCIFLTYLFSNIWQNWPHFPLNFVYSLMELSFISLAFTLNLRSTLKYPNLVHSIPILDLPSQTCCPVSFSSVSNRIYSVVQAEFDRISLYFTLIHLLSPVHPKWLEDPISFR